MFVVNACVVVVVCCLLLCCFLLWFGVGVLRIWLWCLLAFVTVAAVGVLLLISGFCFEDCVCL